MWKKYKWAIITGGIVLLLVGGFIENSISSSLNATTGTVQNQTTTYPVAQQTPAVVSKQLQVQGNTVTDGEYIYKLFPISELNSSGSVATEGTIAQVVPDATTKSHTPYYFVLQNGNSYALVGIVVPNGEEQDFDANIFPIGANVLIAGAIFPFDSPPGVVNYSVLMQGTDIIPALRQLNLPPTTPYMLANYQDIEILR
jgi:hypothetical protein